MSEELAKQVALLERALLEASRYSMIAAGETFRCTCGQASEAWDLWGDGAPEAPDIILSRPIAAGFHEAVVASGLGQSVATEDDLIAGWVRYWKEKARRELEAAG